METSSSSQVKSICEKFDDGLNVPNCPGCDDWCTIIKQDFENTKYPNSYSTWFGCPNGCQIFKFDHKAKTWDTETLNGVILFVKQMGHSEGGKPRYRTNALSETWLLARQGILKYRAHKNNKEAELITEVRTSEARLKDAETKQIIIKNSSDEGGEEGEINVADELDELREANNALGKRVARLEELCAENASVKQRKTLNKK